MAAKKAKPTTAVSPEHIDADGFYCVKGALLWKYRALDAEARNAGLSLQRAQEAIAREIAAHPTLKGLFADEKEALKNLSTKKSEIQAVYAEIGALFGVDLKDCAIDDETGRLHVLGDGGQPKPLRPVAGKKIAKKSARVAAKE